MIRSLRAMISRDKYNIIKGGFIKNGTIVTHYLDIDAAFKWVSIDRTEILDMVDCIERPDDGSEDISLSRREVLRWAFLRWYNISLKKFIKMSALHNSTISIFCSEKFDYPIWEHDSNYIKLDKRDSFLVQFEMKKALGFLYVPKVFHHDSLIDTDLDFRELFRTISAISFKQKKRNFIILFNDMYHAYKRFDTVHKTPIFYNGDKVNVFSKGALIDENDDKQLYHSVTYNGDDIDFLNKVSTFSERPVSYCTCEIKTDLFCRPTEVTIF